jgi:hypothetical protein
MEANSRTREIRLRRAAARQGLVLSKSRRRDPRASDFGTFRLTPRTGLFGSPWDGVLPSLDEVEDWLVNAGRCCEHCGRTAAGYARDAAGNRLCHTGEGGPDCFRRVTVYGEPLGILDGTSDLPKGVADIRRPADA